MPCGMYDMVFRVSSHSDPQLRNEVGNYPRQPGAPVTLMPGARRAGPNFYINLLLLTPGPID